MAQAVMLRKVWFMRMFKKLVTSIENAKGSQKPVRVLDSGVATWGPDMEASQLKFLGFDVSHQPRVGFTDLQLGPTKA